MEANKNACLEAVAAAQPSGHNLSADLMWNACSCDHLPIGLDLFVLDTAIVCGAEATLRWLKLALRTSEAATSSQVIQLARATAIRPIILDLESYRKRALRLMPGWIDHHTKWVNRVIQIKKRAVRMAGGEIERQAKLAS